MWSEAIFDRSTINILKRAISYLKPYWSLQIACFGVAASLAVLSLVQPWVNKLLIDNVLLAGDINGLKLVSLLLVCGLLLRIGCSILLSYLYARAGGSAVLDLRESLFRHIQSLSLPFFHRSRTGELIATFTSDTARMRTLYTSTIVDFVTDTLRLCVLLVAMYLINLRLAIIATVSLPIYALYLRKIGIPIRRASLEVQEKTAATTGDLHERISGIRETKAFTQEDSQLKAMVSSFRSLFRARVRLSVVGALGGLTGVISAFAFGIVIWLGGQEVIAGEMKTGVFIAFLGYMGSLYGPVNTYVTLNTNVQSAVGAAQRVFRIMDEEPTVIEPDRPRSVDDTLGAIEFRNVYFGYGKGTKYEIRDISMSVDRGETLALVGPSGSGKTTIAMLLLRYYAPEMGSILVNGVDVREMDISTYRRRVGVVFQDPFFFNASIRFNIGFGEPDATDDEILRAAKTAHASEFIDELPDGIDTNIGERGVCLSGGQLQRIAIARTILRDPDVVVFDEATSALDTESERYVQKAVKDLLRDRTSIVIAHRLSTVSDADRIVLVNHGRIEEQGSYSDLMRVKGRFWRLYKNE